MQQLLQVYSDESGFPGEPVQSVAVLVGTPDYYAELVEQASILIDAYHKDEIKFSRIRTNRRYFDLGLALITFLCNALESRDLYVLVATQRHTQEFSPIPALYERIFAHLNERFPDRDIAFMPDRNNALHRGSQDFSYFKNYHIRSITETDSEEHMLVQLADLLAGLATYTVQHVADYQTRLHPKTRTQLPKAHKYRCMLIDHFLNELTRVGIPAKLLDNGRYHTHIDENITFLA